MGDLGSVVAFDEANAKGVALVGFEHEIGAVGVIAISAELDASRTCGQYDNALVPPSYFSPIFAVQKDSGAFGLGIDKDKRHGFTLGVAGSWTTADGPKERQCEDGEAKVHKECVYRWRCRRFLYRIA